MVEKCEKSKAMAAQGNSAAIDKGLKMFHAFHDTLVENWQSGIAGKVFLVACVLILLWLIAPLFTGDEVDSSDVRTAGGAATPTAVLKRYYQAYFDGDLNGYMSCLDRAHEQDQDAASEIVDNFNRDDWREKVRTLYGTVSYGVPKLSEDDKMDIKVELENRAQGGSSIKEWYLININGAWFIDTQRTTNPFEMGL